MKSMLFPTLILIALLTNSACGRLIEKAGEITGGIAGTKLATIIPVPTSTVTTNKGGNWCDTMNSMGGLIKIQLGDVLTRPTTERIVTQDRYGQRYCGWKSK